MGSFGPRRPEPFKVRAPGPPRGPGLAVDERALHELRLAARAAEEAERDLDAIEATYRREPSAPTLRRLAVAAGAALEKELAFEAVRARIAHGASPRPRLDPR